MAFRISPDILERFRQMGVQQNQNTFGVPGGQLPPAPPMGALPASPLAPQLPPQAQANPQLPAQASPPPFTGMMPNRPAANPRDFLMPLMLMASPRMGSGMNMGSLLPMLMSQGLMRGQ